MKNIITDFGAVPGNVVDCTAAFAAAMLVGGKIFVPAGVYRVSALSDACIVARLPTRLIGEGLGISIILPDAATAPGVDAITYRPNVGGVSDGWGMEDIGIAPALGSGMRHAVRIDLTTSGAYLARSTFNRLGLTAGAGADSAFKLDNPTNTDGLFCGEICGKGIMYGGINLERCGDSFSIKDQTITGPNVGIAISAVSGAAQCRIQDNNITSTGGAIFLEGCKQAKVVGNQCEQSSVYTGVLGAMIVLSDCYDCKLDGNNMNSYGNTNCVIIENGSSSGNILRDNDMLTGAPYVHLAMGANCPGNALAADNRCYTAGSWGAPLTAIPASSLPMWSV